MVLWKLFWTDLCFFQNFSKIHENSRENIWKYVKGRGISINSSILWYLYVIKLYFFRKSRMNFKKMSRKYQENFYKKYDKLLIESVYYSLENSLENKKERKRFCENCFGPISVFRKSMKNPWKIHEKSRENIWKYVKGYGMSRKSYKISRRNL